MKLAEFVVEQAIVPELSATDRNGAIRELASALVSAGVLNEADGAEIAKAVITRENQGSTGFGKGVAVPHAKHARVSRVIAAVGRSSAGIDFSALDRKPVYTVILLLSPPESPDAHLQAMECIFRHLQRDNFRRFLVQSTTREQIVDLLREADDMAK